MKDIARDVAVSTNLQWGGVKSRFPFITVITPVFNRCRTLGRAMDSVERQTFRDIEYIVIDDGSTDAVDGLVNEYMKKTELPMMFIKKKNGGVHTARNMGYEYARGLLILCIDSDDELLPDACGIFYRAWHSIPENKRERYWQIKAQCADMEGRITGMRFPDNINEMDADEGRKYFSIAKGEQIGCRVAKILKENRFPEPEGVSFVTENALWIPLENRYLSWGINEVVRIYHTEGNDHLSGKASKDLQSCRNILWNAMNFVNHSEQYGLSRTAYMKEMLRYCIMAHILNRKDRLFVRKYKIRGLKNKACRSVLWIPSVFATFVYMRTRMS